MDSLSLTSDAASKARATDGSGDLWSPPISENPRPLSELLRTPDLPTGSLNKPDSTADRMCETKAVSRESGDMWNPPVSDEPAPLSELLRSSSSVPATPRTSNRMMSLPIQSATKMKSPYQNIPSPNDVYYLYEFRLPEPVMLAKLVGVLPECFGKPDQTIGFLFSKPLAEDTNICRIPLYLSRGMARVHVQLSNTIRLSATQFRLVLSTHHILSQLLCELITRDMSSVSNSADDEAALSRLYSQFKYDPQNALICGLICFVAWPSSTVDFQACEQILSGSLVAQTSSTSPTDTASLIPVRGIVPHRRIPLTRLPPESWSGLIVRPGCVAPADLGLFALAGILNSQRTREDVATASVRCCRLSRHPQVTCVSAGGRASDTMSSDPSVAYEARQCTIHPLSAWLWLHLSLVPAVLYEINRALLSVELTRQLAKLCHDPIRARFPVLVPDRLDTPKCMLAKFHPATSLDIRAVASPLWPSDTARDWHQPTGADASHLLEATTTLGAGDIVNLERLELLGDSFLKLIATMVVYQQSPELSDEGQMTNARMVLISNASLEKTAIGLRWPRHCTGRPYLARDHFIPPSYVLSDQADRTMHQERLFMEINRKSVADMVEAVLAYLLTYHGLKAACNLLRHFNISLNIGSARSASHNDRAHVSWDNLFLTADACLTTVGLETLSLAGSPSVESAALSSVEQLLGYRFRNGTHLSHALTHGSAVNTAGSTVSYERLEFLGDAVLDYVVTFYLYNQRTEFDPGDLTTCRSLVTNNVSLAYTVVKLRIHQHIRHNIPNLLSVAAEIEKLQSKEVSAEMEFALLPVDLVKGKPTKILSDVFEAIIGAVFLDSDGNLPVTSQVILKLLGKRIDFIASRLRKNSQNDNLS